MIIHSYSKKSKKKKSPKHVREQHDQWLEKINSMTTNFANGRVKITKPVTPAPFRRETIRHPSLDSGLGACTKPIQGKVYTGDAMIGVSVLHKSNGIPVFRQEDAIDVAKMRRG